MEELQKVFAGAVEKNFGGKIIKFAQLTFRMLTQIEKWAEARYKERRAAEKAERIADMGLDAEPDMSPFDRAKLRLEAADSVQPFSFISELQTIPGMIETLLLSAQVHDPAMTESKLAGLLPFDAQALHNLINELTPTGPETPEERRAELVATARGRLESACAEADTKAGNKECRLKVGDAIKMLYKATGEPVPGTDIPPAQPGSVS